MVMKHDYVINVILFLKGKLPPYQLYSLEAECLLILIQNVYIIVNSTSRMFGLVWFVLFNDTWSQ